MANGLPEPVTGENICPECKGSRIKRLTLSEGLLVPIKLLMFDANDTPYLWCWLCGGEGTASAAMERILIGAV